MRSLFTVLALILALSVSGQYYYNSPSITPGGNPGNLNNDSEEPLGNGLPAGWTDIQPATVPGWTAVQSIPFAFLFNGAAVTQYKVSTSGVLTFTTTATAIPGAPNLSLPNANIPDKSVCIWGLASGSGGFANDKIVTKTFGTAPNRQHWVFFDSYGHNTGSGQCWTYWSIVLEEGSNRIYIVDQRSAWKSSCEPHLTLGIQINSSTAEMVAGSPNVPALAGTSETPADNKYYEFIQGVRPQWDLSIDWLQTNPYLGSTAPPQQIKGTLKNYGAQTVTYYDINYQVNNGPVKTSTETGVNIAMYGDDWFFHDTAWSPSGTGSYTFKVWASNINGHTDDNPFNDTLIKTVDVLGVFVPKILLHEVFNGSNCGECASGNVALKTVLDQHWGEWTRISYPMDGDPYYIADCGTRATYYGIDSLPNMVIHGTNYFYPPSYTDAKYSDYTEPAYLYMSPTHVIAGNTVTVNAAFTPFVANNSPTLKAHIAIVEYQTTGNVGTNGETSFEYVLKKMVPDANGTTVGPFIVGFNPSINKSYTFGAGNTVEQMFDLRVVVFVQDMSTGEVLQSAFSNLSSGVEPLDADGNGLLAVYPNPAGSNVNIKYQLSESREVTVELRDLTGRRVLTEYRGILTPNTYIDPLDTDGLPAGIYLVNLTMDNRSFHSRLVIQ